MSETFLGESDSITLWLIDLDSDVRRAGDRAMLEQLPLSAQEIARARRYAFSRDRARFIAGRLAVRRLLSARLGMDPRQIVLAANARGKPYVARPHMGCQFSLSHCDGWALLAVCDDSEIGADLEMLRDVPEWMQLAEHCLSPRELAALSTVPARERQAAFVTCWTRKEACLKALGTGLGIAPGSFDVGVEAAERVVSIGLRGATSAAAVSGAVRVRSMRVAALLPTPARAAAPPAMVSIARVLRRAPARRPTHPQA
ncbi:MAG TPA: 4'-phosphopantetheinyl transferase superfamily protein [Burkholderiaceae bacterium]|nr:4'-phosphopantetheinyl transferase superfamily protein [Burkholderiaceae bacterium]